MRAPLKGGVALVLILLATAAPLPGQSPVSLGVAAGIAMPFGQLGDAANPGWRALATLDVGVPLMPVSLRIDGAYDRFGFESAPVGAVGRATGAQTLLSGTVNATIGLRTAAPVLSPYAIGGLGPYRVGCAGVASCESVTRMGWNAGAGVRLGLFALHGFAEARFHFVPAPAANLYYVPITVGILF